MRYRSKPTEIEAMQVHPNGTGDLLAWVGDDAHLMPDGRIRLWIKKSSARTVVPIGDWIIKERDGTGFYPCTAYDFAAKYEPA